MLPPSVDQVVAGLRRYPEALAVVYTSPTYEGLCANTHAIAAAVQKLAACRVESTREFGHESDCFRCQDLSGAVRRLAAEFHALNLGSAGRSHSGHSVTKSGVRSLT